MDEYLPLVIAGTIVGFVSRLAFLQTDFRQYPTYPTGRIIHLSFGLSHHLLVPFPFQSALKVDIFKGLLIFCVFKLI